MPLQMLILYVVGSLVGLGLLVIVPVLAIWTEHQRKMAAIVHGVSGVSRGEEFQRLKSDFELLRESLTAHAMSVDENMKDLAGRVNVLERRVTADPIRQNLMGGTS